MGVRRNDKIVEVALDPDDILTRIFMSTTDSEDFGLSAILQDGYTLASLDSRKYTPAVESPRDRRANVKSVCETFGVSYPVTNHLCNIGFQSTALMALSNLMEDDVWQALMGQIGATELDEQRLARLARSIDQYPTEPVHSFLRIAQFRHDEKKAEKGRSMSVRIGQEQNNHCSVLEEYHHCSRSSQNCPLVEALNLAVRPHFGRGQTSNGFELYLKADPQCKRRLQCKATFRADPSPFPPVIVSTLEDIVSAPPHAAEMPTIPIICHQAPPTPMPSPPLQYLPQMIPYQQAPPQLPPNLPHPFNVLFVPVPFESTTGSSPGLPLPFLISPPTLPSQPDTYESQPTPPPAMPLSKDLLQVMESSTGSYMGLNYDGRARSGSSSSVASSNSLHSGLGSMTNLESGTGDDVIGSPRTINRMGHRSNGPHNTTGYNFCPFMNCPYHTKALPTRGRDASLTEHLKNDHNGYDTGRKSQNFVLNSHGYQDEKYRGCKPKYSPRGSWDSRNDYDPSYWMQSYTRLGEVEEAVEYKLLTAEYFWWGPKVFIRDGIEFFVVVFRLDEEDGRYKNKSYQSTKMVFNLQANTTEEVANQYAYNLELPSTVNRGPPSTKGNSTWKPSFYKGKVFPLTEPNLNVPRRKRPDSDPNCIRRMVYFYKHRLPPHVSPTTGKIHFTLGLYKQKDYEG